MDEERAARASIQLNVLAAAIFFVGLVLLVQLILDLTRRGGRGFNPYTHQPSMTAVGFRERSGGESYDSFTIFESDGAVYVYWREGETWKGKPLPHYK